MKSRLIKAVSFVCVIVMLISVVPMTTAFASGKDTITIWELKKQYPTGKYWNGGDPYSYTSVPCNHHGRCSFSGSCGCNTFNKQAIQCMGFAYQLAHMVYGGNPYRDWTKNYSVSALNSLKPGDVVRCNYNRHSIFVTAVDGDTITYADCNSDGHCVIKWDRKITKTKLKQHFSYVTVAPSRWNPTAHTHSYSKSTTAATLTQNGKTENKCTICGHVASKSTKTIYKPAEIKLSEKTFTYDGKTKKPTVIVADSKGKTLKKGTDYTVSYESGRKNVGRYKVTIKFKGNYSGTKTLYFTIKPARTTVASVTGGTKKLTISITKKTAQTTGYEIQYSTNKKFTNAKTKTVKNTTTKFAITKLSSKKTYYVRVRTYKTVGDKTYYSAWSTAKSIKTK